MKIVRGRSVPDFVAAATGMVPPMLSITWLGVALAFWKLCFVGALLVKSASLACSTTVCGVLTLVSWWPAAHPGAAQNASVFGWKRSIQCNWLWRKLLCNPTWPEILLLDLSWAQRISTEMGFPAVELRREGEPLPNEHIGGAGPMGGRKLLTAVGELPMSQWEERLYLTSPDCQKHEICSWLMLRRKLPPSIRTKVDLLTWPFQAAGAAMVVGKGLTMLPRARMISIHGQPEVRLLRKAHAVW